MLAGRHDRWQKDPRAGVFVMAAGIAIAGFVALALAIVLAPAFVRVDMAASAAVRDLDIRALDPLIVMLSGLGDFWPMTVLTGLTAAVLYARGHRVEAVTLVVAVAGGVLIGAGLKMAFARVRPALEFARIPIPGSYSFPSGHALATFLFFGSVAFLALLEDRRLRRGIAVAAVCAVLAAGVAFARVYLGVHYLGDVIGSWLLGCGWMTAVVLVAARWGASPGPSSATAPEADEA